MLDAALAAPTAQHANAPARTGVAGKALVFAWMVEGIAVVMGLVLAIFAGIEGGDSGPAGMVIAILPFVALSFVELTKIPLVALAFRVRAGLWRAIAACALLAITAATFENFVFGFERGFNERIRAVARAEQTVTDRQNALDLARAREPALTEEIATQQARLTLLQKEVEGIRQQAASDIADARADDDSTDYRRQRNDLASALAALDARRDAAVAAERARCHLPTITNCHPSAIAAHYQQQQQGLERQIGELDAAHARQVAHADELKSSTRAGRDVRLKDKEGERARLEARLDAVRTELAAAQQERLKGSESVMQAEHERDERIEHSQLHRLSDVVFGNHDKPNLERTKKIFVVSLAGIVAFIGSIIAAMHYAAQLPPSAARHRLINSLRGYVARRRRRISPVRELHEALRQRQRFWRSLRALVARRRKKVVRIVRVPQDRLKLVYLPLTASEAQVNAVREDARRDASGRAPDLSRPWPAHSG